MTHVELQHITIGYGHRVLLEDVSAAIGGGRLVALLGRNGTGIVKNRQIYLSVFVYI